MHRSPTYNPVTSIPSSSPSYVGSYYYANDESACQSGKYCLNHKAGQEPYLCCPSFSNSCAYDAARAVYCKNATYTPSIATTRQPTKSLETFSHLNCRFFHIICLFFPIELKVCYEYSIAQAIIKNSDVKSVVHPDLFSFVYDVL